MHDVVIVGCGPTGMMLAAELALAGVDALVVERRDSQALPGRRGGGIHSRSIELLDQRGIVDRFLSRGTLMHSVVFAGTALDLGGLPTRHPYTLALFQNQIEEILLAWTRELGVRIRRGVEVVGLAQRDGVVDVHLATGETLRGRYVVGADGGRSAVRTAAGIDFAGPEATRSTLIAELEVTAELPTPPGRIDARGVHGLHRLEDGSVRIVVTEAELRRGQPTLEDLRRELIAVFGTDFGVHGPTWLSRFTDATRQAVDYRRGSVLLAGDAAHVHSPTGGLGIGLGLQDAVNLGWKLAQVVRGDSGDELLDTYGSERHPAGLRALKYTMAQSLFQKADPRQEALRDLLGDVLRVPDAGTPIAALVAGLDVGYDCGQGHPLLGRRVPDLELATGRVFDLLHEARPVLLQFGGPRLYAGDRVRPVAARYDGPWVLPGVGEVAAPTAVLVRPDGHVAWVGQDSSEGLAQAVARWFGG